MIPAVAAAFVSLVSVVAAEARAMQSVATSAREPKVLVIGIDGLRPDALMAADTPAIDALIADGCVTLEASTSQHTVSGPGWSTVLCGVWPDKHRSTDNRFLITDYERFPSLFTLAKRARPAIRTAYFGNWGPIGERILAKDPIDVRVSYQDTKNDAPQTEAAVEALRSDAELDLAFLYVGNVDETGHTVGFHRASPQYLAAIGAADAIVGSAVEAIAARPGIDREDWIVVLVTDHGGTIDLNHGRDIAEHRETPFIVSGDAAVRGRLRGTVNQTDVVATAFAHLGIALDPAWDLDSCAVGLARLAPPQSLYGRNLVVNGDAELASPAEKPEGNRGVAGWRDWGSASTLAYGAHADFPDAATPGSPTRGRAFFFGGGAGESRIAQRIDLTAFARDIDAAAVPFELGAWLGGFARHRDLAWVELAWIDERGGIVGTASLDGASVDDRASAFGGDAPTGFLRRVTGGVVPAGARVAEITLRFERSEGLCDGYADDLSLVLRPAHAVLDCGPAVFVQGRGAGDAGAARDANAADGAGDDVEATVWMRAGVSAATTAAGAALRCVAELESGAVIESTATPDAERDATVRFRLAGLPQGELVRYEIRRVIDGERLAGGSFTTWSDAAARTRIAFGSCADIDESTAQVWRRIAREAPDALVLIGDTPYIDSTSLATQRARHRAFASADAFEALTGMLPLVAVWDDHDFGLNDTDGRLPQRENSRRAFLEYRPLGGAGDVGDGKGGGLYTSFRSGPVEVFVLDTRWFARTEPSRDDPKLPSLLGESQWRWLEAGMRASTAPFKVVASSMVWNNRVRALKSDCWGAYPHEFERFQRMVRETGATGVVLVSGDVHRSRVLVHPTAALAGVDLVEFVTSPLHARVHADAAVTGPEVVFDSGTPNSFLVIEAREVAGTASLSARFTTSSGRVVHERTIELPVGDAKR
jgi:alkaline phosphatase D